MKKYLVMLHGFGCDSRTFASMGTKLSKDYEVLMVDIPGHGQTLLRPEDYEGQAKAHTSFFRYSAYSILHALDQYLKEPYLLLGWSMGGQIALEMFRQKAQGKCKDEKCDHKHNMIDSLILVSSTPKFVASDDFPAGMNKAVFGKFQKGLKADLKKTMHDFYHLIFSENEEASKFAAELSAQTPAPETLSACMDSFENFDGRKSLAEITVPTLIIAGDKDRIIDHKASEFLANNIKGSALKILEGAGHAPHLTREKEMIDDISKFLG
jgi:pimeloyl-[acyl-carrier protein] methyl ester esterase